MSTSLYAKYIKEREGKDIVEWEHGFLTYKKLSNDLYYLIDCFVEKEYRRTSIARQLVDKVCEIAKADGARQVMGSVCTDAEGVTVSIASLLGGNFRFSSQQGNMLYFVKDI